MKTRTNMQWGGGDGSLGHFYKHVVRLCSVPWSSGYVPTGLQGSGSYSCYGVIYSSNEVLSNEDLSVPLLVYCQSGGGANMYPRIVGWSDSISIVHGSSYGGVFLSYTWDTANKVSVTVFNMFIDVYSLDVILSSDVVTKIF